MGRMKKWKEGTENGEIAIRERETKKVKMVKINGAWDF